MPHYASIPDLFPMQGGCPCGQTRFQMLLPPLIVHCCHCTACQRQQGTAFALNAVIESEHLSLLPPLFPPTVSDSSSAAAEDPARPALATSASPAISRLVNAELPPNLDPGKREEGRQQKQQPTEPELITVPTASGAGQHIARCPSCHAGLWSYYAAAGHHQAYVRVGALDRGVAIDPDVHIYTRTQRQSIFTIADGKPQFDEYYPDRAAFYREDCKDRVEALEPKVREWREDMMRVWTM